MSRYINKQEWRLSEQYPVVSFCELAERLKNNMPRPFALQIGAMDGKRFDLLYAHLISGDWNGLLVEPVPEMFELLQKNYAGCSGLILENCAVADYEGVLGLSCIDPGVVEKGLVTENLLGVTTARQDNLQIGSDAFHNRYPFILKEYVRHIEVPCYTLPRLLTKHNVTKIDLVMTDTEGMDWIILRQLDLKTYEPSIICLEYTQLGAAGVPECVGHFLNHGYQMAICREDPENLIFHKNL